MSIFKKTAKTVEPVDLTSKGGALDYIFTELGFFGSAAASVIDSAFSDLSDKIKSKKDTKSNNEAKTEDKKSDETTVTPVKEQNAEEVTTTVTETASEETTTGTEEASTGAEEAAAPVVDENGKVEVSFAVSDSEKTEVNMNPKMVRESSVISPIPGCHIDTAGIAGVSAEDVQPTGIYVEPAAGQINPFFDPQNPMMTQQQFMGAPVSPIPGMAQQPVPTMVMNQGEYQHRSDEPPKPPVVKAEADNVNVDMSNISFGVNPIMPKQWPEGFQPIPAAEKSEGVPFTNAYDNTAMKEQYPLLAEIEAIANSHNESVHFYPFYVQNGQKSDIVVVDTYSADQIQLLHKQFLIDNGKVIDGRTKIFTAYPFEGQPDYDPYVKGKEGSKPEINKALFDQIFTGGTMAISKMRTMHNKDRIAMNMDVAMITCPNLKDSDTKGKLIKLIGEMRKAHVFDEARICCPNSRWVFDKNATNGKISEKNFELNNNGIPMNYGYRHFPTPICKIRSFVEGDQHIIESRASITDGSGNPTEAVRRYKVNDDLTVEKIIQQ